MMSSVPLSSTLCGITQTKTRLSDIVRSSRHLLFDSLRNKAMRHRGVGSSIVRSAQKDKESDVDLKESLDSKMVTVEDAPPLPPDDASSDDGSSIDEEDNWPSFWPDILKLDKGDVLTVVIALGISSFIRWGIAEPRYIPSLSMYPYFDIGDRLIAEKITYRFMRSPQPGDVIIFHPADGAVPKKFFGEDVFIKRIVGLAGDTIEVKDGSLYVNGVKRNEPFLPEKPAYYLEAFTIPPDTVFVMGDNRNNSYDSHLWGPLPVEKIIGRACFVYWPLNKFGLLPDYSSFETSTPPTVIS